MAVDSSVTNRRKAQWRRLKRLVRHFLGQGMMVKVYSIRRTRLAWKAALMVIISNLCEHWRFQRAELDGVAKRTGKTVLPYCIRYYIASKWFAN
jgi:hypothetical protein